MKKQNKTELESLGKFVEDVVEVKLNTILKDKCGIE